MLSYQHLYHAGNLADVHKHALLAVALEYLARKDKPLSYIETHAGRGLYDLTAAEALKTGEAAGGITRLLAEGWFAPEHPYRRAIEMTRARHGEHAYPGSPLIAAQVMRETDRLEFAELHPQEHAALSEALVPFGRRPHREEGLAYALSLAPPEPRRGFVLLDPSYEVKSDYAAMPRFVAALRRKWNVAVAMLWYPILAEGLHEGMLRELDAADYPHAFRHEVRFPPIRPGHGLLGSGVFFVSAPFGIGAEAERLGSLFAKLA